MSEQLVMRLPTDDPRPDLLADSRLWWSLLNLAWGHDHDLWAALHGLRCMGACIIEGGRLVRGSYITTDEYVAWRAEYLLPKAELLQSLILSLHQSNHMVERGGEIHEV